VVLDANEFSTDFLKIAEKLEQSEEYEQRFLAAYPLAKISKYSISNALAAYLSTLTSFDSPFDQYIRGETAEIDPAVERGFNLFMGKAACGTCHFAPTFSGLVPPYFQESESEVLGVPVAPESDQIDPDQGRMASTRPRDEAPFYQHSFKTTTVRNIALTAPYMHNGAYPDLKSVLDFYNKGGGVGSGIDLPYQTLAPDPLNLTDQEIDDLIAFMESLTDTSKAGSPPTELPVFAGQPELNQRPIGGAY
ncbi:MAG: cytochrome c peroxidase, partial [Bacteroidota bacterium]